ncbi:MAG TPA: SPOR domain-containing protein [Sphingobium sp.]
MRAALVGTIVATCAASMATPASADVKAGVDAWQQGDYAKAIAEWRPLAAAGDPDAQFNLGQAYKLGRGVPTDVPIAMDWFRKASVQGHLRAADNLGLLLFQQGKREEAIPFIRKSAERGEPRAQYILGTALFNGDLVGKDWVQAYALMTRAASSGLEPATASLTTMDKYISTEQRQKGLALAADMGRAPKAADYAAAPAPTQASTPPPTVPRASPVQAPPRQVASVPPRPSLPSRVPPRSADPYADAPPGRESRPGATYDTTPDRDSAPPSRSTAPPPLRGTAKPPPSVAQAPPAAPRPAKPPGDAPPPTTVAKPPASGSWRIQMGAFREEPRAKALWQAATSRVSGLSDYKLFLVKGGDVTRVQAGPLRSEADAARLCGKLRAAGYTCLPRPN